ncbi:hypothetical protein DIS24_g6131 [Lasiodiplodia hormozganensis]|uniref:Uncharacterized protein n=1 Tax=Lasiodiplodia hormozganensis TaxID=869390 RepID=A0AA39YIT1_9PEZI|nr:hypothetical protein DIS24_g6131 [Lasiodiplodia hormozganensis]
MVTADQITLAGFPEMFCRTHLTYRNAEQLSRPGGFDELAIKLQWDFDDSDSMPDSTPELLDASTLLGPFRALRNVMELKIKGLGTWIEDAMEMGDMEGEMIDEWEEVIAYKKTMRDILGSNAPVNENPIPLSTWLGFKQTVRRIIFFAPQVGAQKYLEQAAEAVRIQDKNAFQKASNSLLKGWKGELRQRKKIASQIDELREATYLDIPPGKRKEDGPEGVELSGFTWSDPTIDKEDREAYIGFLESIGE